MVHGRTRVVCEGKFIVLLVGLHIEMISLKVLGHWLEGSGWVECLDAGIATPKIAESFLKATHATRTRHARQLSDC